MRALKVLISASVREQIRSQVFFIAKDSIDNALAWEDRLHAAINNIGRTQADAVDEAASNRLGYIVRKSIFERTYLIHYRVNESAGVVEIVNFRHGARLPNRDEP